MSLGCSYREDIKKDLLLGDFVFSFKGCEGFCEYNICSCICFMCFVLCMIYSGICTQYGYDCLP